MFWDHCDEMAKKKPSKSQAVARSLPFGTTSPQPADSVTPNGVTLSQLESHLWEAANILRGPVDAADFKTYVFPLLFFKRISDVHDEEYQAALSESDGDEEYALFPQNYRFQIPEDCHWDDVRKVATNVGQALQKAIRGIEKANPETLYGIFGDAAWTNKDRLPDSLLRDLIEHFSKIKFGNQAAQADILGQSYEYLIKKFADATNKKAGEFYTPRSVVRLMVNILDPKEGESIYDPACGTGGMLLEAIQHVKENHGSEANNYWRTGNCWFTRLERLESLSRSPQFQGPIAGIILVDPVLRTQFARGLKGSAWEHHERPQLLNAFRKDLAEDGLRPPLLMMACPPAMSLNTLPAQRAYCLESMWYCDGSRLRIGAL